MITLPYELNLYPASTPIAVHVSQYDSDFSIVFTLVNTHGTFTLESGTTAEIRGTKRDGNGYSASCTIDITNKKVTVQGDQQMTAVAGANVYEIALLKNSKVLNTANFVLVVERAALDADTIQSETVLRELNAIIAGAAEATQAAEDASDAADRAEAAAETLEIDNTLTQQGQAADAKATGDAVNELSSAITKDQQNISDLNGIYPVALSSYDDGYGYSGAVGETISKDTYSSSYAYDAIDLSDFAGCKVVVKFTTSATSSNRETALCDSSGKIASRYYEKNMTSSGFEFDVTPTNKYLYISVHKYNTSGVTVTVYSDLVGLPKAESDISNIQSEMKKPFDISEMFEYGNINYSNSGWTYNNNANRLRTMKGKSVHLLKGTKLGLTSYTNLKYNLSWKTVVGTYGSVDWQTNDYTTTVEGDYVMVITYDPATFIADMTTITSLIFGYVPTIGYDEKSCSDYVVKIKRITTVEHDGYFSTTGSISAQNSTKLQKYTDKIPVSNGMRIIVSIAYSSAVGQMAIYYVTYDKEKHFIARNTIIDVADGKTFKYGIDIDSDNVGFIALAYTTYGIATVNVYSDDISQIIQNKIIQNANDAVIYNWFANNIVKGVNHRGYNSVAPENTLPAYKLSRRNGFIYAETDVAFTGDNPPVPVLMHDSTINRTCCNASDGSEISDTVIVSETTYEDLLDYDACTPSQYSQYAGTKIPTLKQFFTLCRNIGLRPYVEIKASNISEEKANLIVDIAAEYGMAKDVTWVSFDSTVLGYVKARNSKARIGLLVNTVNESAITTAQSLKNETNEVFVDSGSYTTEEVALCKNAGIPLEVWTINTESGITGLDVYVSGVTSDKLNAGYVLFTNNM